MYQIYDADVKKNCNYIFPQFHYTNKNYGLQFVNKVRDTSEAKQNWIPNIIATVFMSRPRRRFGASS